MRKLLSGVLLFVFVFGSFLGFSSGAAVSAVDYVSLLPVFSSANTGGYTIGCSTSYSSSYEAWRLVDKNKGTSWVSAATAFVLNSGSYVSNGVQACRIMFPNAMEYTRLDITNHSAGQYGDFFRTAQVYGVVRSGSGMTEIFICDISVSVRPTKSGTTYSFSLPGGTAYDGIYIKFLTAYSSTLYVGEIDVLNVVPDPVDDPDANGGLGGGGTTPPVGGGSVSPGSGSASYGFVQEGIYDLKSMGLLPADSYSSVSVKLYRQLQLPSLYLSSDYVYTISYRQAFSAGDRVPTTPYTTSFILPSGVASKLDWYELGSGSFYGDSGCFFVMTFRVKESGVFPIGSIYADYSGDVVFSSYTGVYRDEYYKNSTYIPFYGNCTYYASLQVTRNEANAATDQGSGLVDDSVMPGVDSIMGSGAMSEIDGLQNDVAGLYDATGKSKKIMFPGFKLEVQGQSYQVWADTPFDFQTIEDNFSVLVVAVRAILVFVVYAALIMYIINVVSDIFEKG